MSALSDKGGVLQQGLPFELKFDRVIEEAYGPVVVLFRNNAAEPFLDIWLERSEGVDQWLLLRLSERELLDFESRKRTLRDTMLDARDGYGFLRAVRRREVLRTAILAVEKLPIEYHPAKDSYHIALERRGPLTRQKFLLDGKWDLDLLKQFQWKYDQVYAFLGVFGSWCDGATNPIPIAAGKFGAGWHYKSIFERILRMVPEESRPDMNAVQYASPGYLSLKVDPHIAAEVVKLIGDYPLRKKELRKKYHLAHGHVVSLGKLLDVKKTGKPKEKGAKDNAAERVALEAKVEKSARELANALRFVDYDRISRATGSAYVSGELVVAAFRRMEELLKFGEEQANRGCTAEMVGLPDVFATPFDPDSSFEDEDEDELEY